MTVSDDKAAKCEALMSDAFALLQDGKPEKALEIGRKLERQQYSGGFEIQALAYADMDKLPKAVRVLEKGTGIVPDVWLLWQLLGNCRSDLGRYADACEAYVTGLALEDADQVSLKSNYALALLRKGDIDKAEEISGQLLNDKKFEEADQGAKFLAYASHIEILHQRILDDEVIRFYRSLTLDDADDDAVVYVPGIVALYAHALWRNGEEAEGKTELARAIAKDKHNQKVHWVFREIYGGTGGEKLNYYRLLVHGTWPRSAAGERSSLGFYTSYDVVAQDEAEALAFVKAFEPKPVRPTLAIEKAKILGRRTDHKGVYATTGYEFYDE